MTSAQISTILRKAGNTKAGYAPGQRIRYPKIAGYSVHKMGDAVRVDYHTGSAAAAAQLVAAVALTSYRRSIEAAGYVVETVDTGVTQYLLVTERQDE
jgi:hypothetical protein